LRDNLKAFFIKENVKGDQSTQYRATPRLNQNFQRYKIHPPLSKD
jgi:hypothetical protein